MLYAILIFQLRHARDEKRIHRFPLSYVQTSSIIMDISNCSIAWRPIFYFRQALFKLDVNINNILHRQKITVSFINFYISLIAATKDMYLMLNIAR